MSHPDTTPLPESRTAGESSFPADPPTSGLNGFAHALLDTSFARFATPSMVRVLYIGSMLFAGLYWIGSVVVLFMAASHSQTTITGPDGLQVDTVNKSAVIMAWADAILGWLPALLALAFVRMALELVMATIRTSEYARDIKAHLTGSERPNL